MVVATLQGRSYYKIISALKSLGLKFDSVLPGEVHSFDSQLVITTEEERQMIDHDRILLDSELDDELALVKAKILRSMMNAYHDDQLIIGIDPGRRIGLAALYLEKEIESRVLTSTKAAVDLVVALADGIRSGRKIIRIGDGDKALARTIASGIHARLKNKISIELVNEHGTSSAKVVGSKRRDMRDSLSARAIALRRGRTFRPYGSGQLS